MRKLLRRILWLVKGLLLAVTLAVVVLWVRSYWRCDSVWHIQRGESERRTTSGPEMVSQLGWVSAAWTEVLWPAQPPIYDSISGGFDGRSGPAGNFVQNIREEHGLGPVHWGRDWLRQYSTNKEKRLFYDSHVIRVRHWLLAIVCGAWPIASLYFLTRRAIKRRRLMRAGCCKSCGYDLRATPQRCPECGAVSLNSNASVASD
jgi:hypothetical protein